MFKRREKLSWKKRLSGYLWPQGGWKRYGRFILLKLHRLGGTPRSIAAGFACGAAISFTVPLAATGFLYLVLFGLFTKGGRGYCRFMCPQGAMQSLFFIIGSKLGIASKIQVNREKCVKCRLCVKNCPMRAMSLKNGSIKNDVSLCIKCGVCQHNCPVKAITTGGGRL